MWCSKHLKTSFFGSPASGQVFDWFLGFSPASCMACRDLNLLRSSVAVMGQSPVSTRSCSWCSCYDDQTSTCLQNASIRIKWRKNTLKTPAGNDRSRMHKVTSLVSILFQTNANIISIWYDGIVHPCSPYQFCLTTTRFAQTPKAPPWGRRSALSPSLNWWHSLLSPAPSRPCRAWVQRCAAGGRAAHLTHRGRHPVQPKTEQQNSLKAAMSWSPNLVSVEAYHSDSKRFRFRSDSPILHHEFDIKISLHQGCSQLLDPWATTGAIGGWQRFGRTRRWQQRFVGIPWFGTFAENFGSTSRKLISKGLGILTCWIGGVIAVAGWLQIVVAFHLQGLDVQNHRINRLKLYTHSISQQLTAINAI